MDEHQAADQEGGRRERLERLKKAAKEQGERLEADIAGGGTLTALFKQYLN